MKDEEDLAALYKGSLISEANNVEILAVNCARNIPCNLTQKVRRDKNKKRAPSKVISNIYPSLGIG